LLGLVFGSCNNGTTDPGGGGDNGGQAWRSELIPRNHYTEAGHKYGEWESDDGLTRLWIGNNKGNSFITVNKSGTKFSYDLQAVDNKSAGQTSSFSIQRQFLEPG
jgi:hypothetical protein